METLQLKKAAEAVGGLLPAEDALLLTGEERRDLLAEALDRVRARVWKKEAVVGVTSMSDDTALYTVTKRGLLMNHHMSYRATVSEWGEVSGEIL